MELCHNRPNNQSKISNNQNNNHFNQQNYQSENYNHQATSSNITPIAQHTSNLSSSYSSKHNQIYNNSTKQPNDQFLNPFSPQFNQQRCFNQSKASPIYEQFNSNNSSQGYPSHENNRRCSKQHNNNYHPDNAAYHQYDANSTNSSNSFGRQNNNSRRDDVTECIKTVRYKNMQQDMIYKDIELELLRSDRNYFYNSK